MKHPRRQFLHLAAGAAALPAVSQFAWPQAYPSLPVRFVVSFAASRPLYKMVAKGDAEIGFNQISQVMAQPSVELIGSLLATIQTKHCLRRIPADEEGG